MLEVIEVTRVISRREIRTTLVEMAEASYLRYVRASGDWLVSDAADRRYRQWRRREAMARRFADALDFVREGDGDPMALEMADDYLWAMQSRMQRLDRMRSAV